jgi:large subunit ribosomal protein L5
MSKAQAKIKRDDTVIVIAGKHKGKTGRVLKVLPSDRRVIVEKVNLVKRQVKPQGDRPGGTMEKEASLHISNVALYDGRQEAHQDRLQAERRGQESPRRSQVRRRGLRVRMQPNLHTHYRDVVAKGLIEEFSYENPMLVPKLQKIVVNTSIKEATSNAKLIESAAEELTLLTGQKAIIRKAKKSIANFKLREGMPIGAKVTLRGAQMWYFLERLISIAIPRIRDFRGVSPTGFDGRGNYSLGLAEQLIFPELDYDKVTRVSGMNITFVTSARTDREALALLRRLGMPFRDQ